MVKNSEKSRIKNGGDFFNESVRGFAEAGNKAIFNDESIHAAVFAFWRLVSDSFAPLK